MDRVMVCRRGFVAISFCLSLSGMVVVGAQAVSAERGVPHRDGTLSVAASPDALQPAIANGPLVLTADYVAAPPAPQRVVLQRP